MSDAERYELTEHVIERFREIMPSRSVEVFFQLEFISEGPTIYFSRQDVRNDFGITDEQLSELEDIARKRFEEFNNDDSSRRMDVILAMWNELSDDQLEKAELLFGLKTESIFETLYHSVHRNNRTVRFGLGATRDDFYRQHSKNYSELASGLLFGLFVDELEKPRDEPLVTGVDIVLKDFIDPIGIVPDRTSNWLTVENARGQGALPILRNLREILNKSEYPLNKQQEHAYDLMLNGTKETDGLGEYYFGRRLQRKAGPFAESLTAAQRQIAREVIILHIGANRLLMNEPMISKLEVTNEQRKAMLEKSRAAWLAYLEWQRAYKMESYQEMMGVLTKKQQTQFEILVGDPIEKVVFRLRNTAHDAFMMDLDKDIRAKIKR